MDFTFVLSFLACTCTTKGEGVNWTGQDRTGYRNGRARFGIGIEYIGLNIIIIFSRFISLFLRLFIFVLAGLSVQVNSHTQYKNQTPFPPLFSLQHSA